MAITLRDILRGAGAGARSFGSSLMEIEAQNRRLKEIEAGREWQTQQAEDERAWREQQTADTQAWQEQQANVGWEREHPVMSSEMVLPFGGGRVPEVRAGTPMGELFLEAQKRKMGPGDPQYGQYYTPSAFDQDRLYGRWGAPGTRGGGGEPVTMVDPDAAGPLPAMPDDTAWHYLPETDPDRPDVLDQSRALEMLYGGKYGGLLGEGQYDAAEAAGNFPALISRYLELMRADVDAGSAWQQALQEAGYTPGEKRRGMFNWDWIKRDRAPSFSATGRRRFNPVTGEFE